MEMLITAKQNRIKALNALQRKKRVTCTPRPEAGIVASLPTFRSTRFDFPTPYLLT